MFGLMFILFSSVDSLKMWLIYIHTTKYYLAVKRKEIPIHVARWINLKNIMLNEKRQSQNFILYDSMI